MWAFFNTLRDRFILRSALAEAPPQEIKIADVMTPPVKALTLEEELRARGVPILDKECVEKHKANVLQDRIDEGGYEAEWETDLVTNAKDEVPPRLAKRVGIAQELGAEVYIDTFYRDPFLRAVRGSEEEYIGAYDTGVKEFDRA